MKISIALAAYNGAEYLQDQLDSYVTQERIPDEIVVCDDVSKDETLVMLEEFQKVAPFEVKIIKNEINLGYTKNFEKALSLCTGEIIFFSDQDDVWLPNKISTIVKFFSDNPDISVLIHDGELVTEDLGSTGLTKLGQIRSGGYGDDDFVTGTLSAIRRDILKVVLPFPDGISGGHDGWVHTIAILMNRRVVIEDILQKLRRHSGNTSDWVASSLQKINRIDVFNSNLSKSAAKSYQDRIYYNKSLQEKFSQLRSEKINYKFDVDFKDINQKLKIEYDSLIKREELLSYGFFGRKLYALQMLGNGDYRHFNGVRSFIRDFLR